MYEQQQYGGGQPGGPPPGRWQQGQGAPHQWDNMPQQPPIDNPNAGPPQQQAMNIQGMPQFQGYGGVAGFDNFACMPPPPPPPPPSGPPPQMDFKDAATLDERQCREAMISFVAENCCYGSKPAKEHKITKIQASTALHYILETYCEGRSTAWKHEPFRGQPIDGPQNGMPPGPWDMPCQPDSMFQNQKKYLEVPHTATVKPCQRCDARGYLRCHRCQGSGQVRCGACGGDGRVSRYNHETQQHHQVSCHSCGGDGRRSCGTCGGDGRITCTTCDGYRSLKCFLQLEVTYTNHKEDYILEGTDLPDHLVGGVQGDLVFEQTMFQVWPIQHYPVAQVAQNSVRLVESHRGKFRNEKQLQQRQTLQAVPVTEVDAQWDDWKSRYWVYGLERKVHSPDYPQTCCWGCQII